LGEKEKENSSRVPRCNSTVEENRLRKGKNASSEKKKLVRGAASKNLTKVERGNKEFANLEKETQRRAEGRGRAD